MKAIQEKKTIKEIFKELWLKYGDYNKCIEEFKKIGKNPSYRYLEALRSNLNLPKMREIILSRKCFYCGRNAEKITYEYSPTSEAIPICKKCYKKLEFKKRYKKHRKELLRKDILSKKTIRLYIGKEICPICMKEGYLRIQYQKWISTGHLIGPYFVIEHQLYYNGKEKIIICWIGKNQDFIEKYSQYLLLCNCKKCRLKRGEINGSNTERENNRRDI